MSAAAVVNQRMRARMTVAAWALVIAQVAALSRSVAATAVAALLVPWLHTVTSRMHRRGGRVAAVAAMIAVPALLHVPPIASALGIPAGADGDSGALTACWMTASTIAVGILNLQAAAIAALAGLLCELLLAFASLRPLCAALPLSLVQLAVVFALAHTSTKERAAHSRQVREVRQALHDRTAFLHYFSHELRTPLHSINAAVSLLTTGSNGFEPNSEQHALLNAASAASRATISLLDEFLHIARIEAGHSHAPQLVDFDLFAFIEDACAAVATLADARNIEFAVSIDPALEDAQLLRGDVSKLRHILTNLITNAIKFTASGGLVLVGVQPRAHPAEQAFESRDDKQQQPAGQPVEIEFFVYDNGCGIDSRFLPHIFAPFRRALSRDLLPDAAPANRAASLSSLTSSLSSTTTFSSPSSSPSSSSVSASSLLRETHVVAETDEDLPRAASSSSTAGVRVRYSRPFPRNGAPPRSPLCSPSRSTEGHGLGLSLVKNFVELLGGSIAVRSREGVGSVFTFWVPLQHCATAAAPLTDDKRVLTYAACTRIIRDAVARRPLRVLTVFTGSDVLHDVVAEYMAAWGIAVCRAAADEPLPPCDLVLVNKPDVLARLIGGAVDGERRCYRILLLAALQDIPALPPGTASRVTVLPRPTGLLSVARIVARLILELQGRHSAADAAFPAEAMAPLRVATSLRHRAVAAASSAQRGGADDEQPGGGRDGGGQPLSEDVQRLVGSLRSHSISQLAGVGVATGGRDQDRLASERQRLLAAEEDAPAVLIADDDAINRQLLAKVLGGAGLRVLTAADGDVAINVFRENADRIALLVLDLSMPHTGGELVVKAVRAWEACAADHARATTRRVAWALSGHVSSEAREQALSAGFDDYLTKPFSIDAMRGRLRVQDQRLYVDGRPVS